MRRQWCFQNKELEEEYSKYIKFKQRKDEDWLWATKECDITERNLWKRKKAKKQKVKDQRIEWMETTSEMISSINTLKIEEENVATAYRRSMIRGKRRATAGSQ